MKWKHPRATAALAAAGVLVLVGPSPAEAHPFGDPQTVAISLDAQRARVVRINWRVGGPDDLTLLGVSFGLLPQERVKDDGNVDYLYSDPGVVSASPLFTSYLLDRITVTAGSQPCTGAVREVRALALKGATVDYTCAAPVTDATVAVRMLTDLNPAYRTLATGPGGERAVYSDDNDTHTWQLVGAGASGSTLLQLAAVVGALLALAAVAVVAWRKRVAA